MRTASSLMHCSLGRKNLCEVEGKDSVQMEADWAELWTESHQRTSAEPVLCQGVNALGDGGSGANGGKTLHASWPGVVFSGKVRAPIRDTIPIRPETAVCHTAFSTTGKSRSSFLPAKQGYMHQDCQSFNSFYVSTCASPLHSRAGIDTKRGQQFHQQVP